MLRKTVPDAYSGDWKSSVVVGWESGTVHVTKRNADAFETPSLLNDQVRQWWCQAMKSDEDICEPKRPAWNLSAMELSVCVIGVGAAWCDCNVVIVQSNRTKQSTQVPFLGTIMYDRIQKKVAVCVPYFQIHIQISVA